MALSRYAIYTVNSASRQTTNGGIKMYNYEHECEKTAREITRETNLTVVLYFSKTLSHAEIEDASNLWAENARELWYVLEAYLSGIITMKSKILKAL